MKSTDDIIKQIKDGALREDASVEKDFPSSFSALMTCKGQAD